MKKSDTQLKSKLELEILEVEPELETKKAPMGIWKLYDEDL